MAARDDAVIDISAAPDESGGGGRRPGSDATLERLRDMILSGELRPGSVVSQLTLARTLGISTTPLREVIRQLQAEGLMQVELNRRPRVAPLDIDDLHGVYVGRILMESLSIGLTVPTLTEADLDESRQDLAEMRAIAATGHLENWSAVHNRFHRRLIVGVPPGIASTVTNFFDRSERYRRLSTMNQPRSWGDADQEHERILNACVAGDARGASIELANHLARTALSLSAVFAPHIDPRAVRLAVQMVGAAEETPGERPKRLRRTG
jgi:DNA-binding GntR family transcriptional regulator